MTRTTDSFGNVTMDGEIFFYGNQINWSKDISHESCRGAWD